MALPTVPAIPVAVDALEPPLPIRQGGVARSAERQARTSVADEGVRLELDGLPHAGFAAAVAMVGVLPSLPCAPTRDVSRSVSHEASA